MPTLYDFVDLEQSEQQARGLLFTPREIAQQPRTWRSTFEIFEREQAHVSAFLERIGLRARLTERPIVVLVGAGTSDYIGQALVALLRQAWRCEVFACPSTTLLTNLDDFIVPGRNYLWISFSRSGDSPEGVAVLEHAIQQLPHVAHLVVTCNAEARMIKAAAESKSSCVLVLDDAVNDRSLAMTSSFTNMVILGHCLAHTWSLQEYAPILNKLQAAAEELLGEAAEAAEQVAGLNLTRVCLVGSGPLESVARESALKILEMTAGQIKTMSESVLGLRHGPMAALDAETLLVCFAPADPRRASYARDLLAEIGAKKIVRGRLVVAPRSLATELEPVSDVFLGLHDGIADLYRPALDVIVGQLMGLFCSVACGLHPDAPSPGGVITRVVGKFQIY